ncbi:MAG: NAD(P)-dependent oxidoreductase [Gemmatimonas sp.]
MNLRPLRSVWSRLTQSTLATLPPASVLVTGASGYVATSIRHELCTEFGNVRLTDCVPLPVSIDEGREHFLLADLANADRVLEVVRGVQQIVHLGAYSGDARIENLTDPNVHGVTHLLDAAVAQGVSRVVLMSSMHVLGLYRRGEVVTPHSVPRPDSFYALTKLYAESLARLYHERHGLSVVIVRPGHVMERAQDAEPNNWVSGSDLARLIVLALRADNIGCEVWHAVASAGANDATHADLARRFGFQFSPAPVDAEDVEAALHRWYPDDTLARLYRGGAFASGRVKEATDLMTQ